MRLRLGAFALFLLATDCTHAQVPIDESPITPSDSLVDLVATLRGYLVEPGANAFYLHPASRDDSLQLAKAIALAEQQTLTLIDCFADTAPTLVLYDNRPVTRGGVCFYVAMRTEWFRRYAPFSDMPVERLLAALVPLRAADLARQQRAREIWRAYYEEKT